MHPLSDYQKIYQNQILDAEIEAFLSRGGIIKNMDWENYREHIASGGRNPDILDYCKKRIVYDIVSKLTTKNYITCNQIRTALIAHHGHLIKNDDFFSCDGVINYINQNTQYTLAKQPGKLSYKVIHNKNKSTLRI